MSPEQQPPQPEAVVEKLPSLGEVESAFQVFLFGKESTVLRTKSNERGVYLYEVVVSLENGETAEYIFQEPVICVAYKGSDGKEYYGQTLANYVDGAWVMAEL